MSNKQSQTIKTFNIMFKEFFMLEIRTQLRQPMVYVFFLVVALMVFGAVVNDDIIIGGDTGNVNKNAPYVIGQYVAVIGLIGIVMITAFMNNAALRDFHYQYDQILFSTPVRKGSYLAGRFLGAYLVSLLPFLGVFAGVLLGVAMPFVPADKVGPFNAQAYLSSLYTFIIPNTFFMGAVIFVLAIRFKSTVVSFIGSISVLVLYIISQGMIGDLDNENLATMLDPLAIRSYLLATKYWTVAEKNTLTVPLEGYLLLNRILWIGVGLVLLLLGYLGFSFSRRKSGAAKRESAHLKNPVGLYEQLKKLPEVSVNFGKKAAWQQFTNQVKVEFLGTIRSVPFIVLLFAALVNTLPSLIYVTEFSGNTISYPVTYNVISTIKGSLFLFVLAIVIYYSGVLVWKERDARMNEFYDAYAFPDWILYTAKVLALSGMVAVILLVAIFSGMLVQAIHGYTRFQPELYISELMLIELSYFLMLIIISVFIHVLVNNKYLGYFVIVAYLIVEEFVISGALEVNHNLLLPGSRPDYTYSDMNGYGPFIPGLTWFTLYWLAFFGLVAVASLLLWPRGRARGFATRLRIAGSRFTPPLARLTGSLALLWIVLGGFIFYNTNILNEYQNPEDAKALRVAYEQKYKQYEGISQPRVSRVHYRIDLEPEERNLFTDVEMVLVNKTNGPVDSLHLSLPRGGVQISDISLNREAELVLDDEELDYRIYHLAEALQAGDSLQLRVKGALVSRGFENEVSNTGITENGSFFNRASFVPSLGYQSNREISSREDREEYELPERPRMASIDDQEARMNNYITNDADWIRMETVISTSPDQIAVAPGTLLKEWEEDGKRYFRYRLDKSVLHFTSFISARYEVKREKWEDVDVEVYYHPEHAYNVDHMAEAIKASLDYYSEHFSPYPHEQARIIEFPRYATFAQAFPGTMPYSEAIGFIENLEDEETRDNVFHTVAHEMAHQWWAHQVIGGNVQGATMLSETMSQYASLMVMDRHKGREHTLEYLRYEMDRYLRRRGAEREKEVPIKLVENMPYIHYQKGSVLLFALQDYMGEDSLNQALQRYSRAVSYQEPPYTTSEEMLDYIRKSAPDSLDYLITDLFDKITLYSNRTLEASYSNTDDGRYEVQLKVSSQKFYADSLGVEKEAALDDWIDIGVYAEDSEGEEELIYLQRKKISESEQTFKVIVDRKPTKAGIDPRNLLIDRIPDDNVKKVRAPEEA